MICRSLALVACLVSSSLAHEVIPIWPGLAPGEKTLSSGQALPLLKDDKTIIRLEKVTSPSMTAYLPSKEKATGAAVIILPGGGFNFVVPNLEGSEAAKFLNEAGVAAFVLNYRTKTKESKADPWRKPLQDSQRAVRYLRTYWEKWGLNPKQIGILAFSAGGQVGAMHLGDIKPAYEPVDGIDMQGHRPDFALLIYPWNTLDAKSGKLLPQIQISKTAPPTFIVHTDDDASTSLGAVEIYAQLKRAKVSGELHIYQNGGHGYGARHRKDSAIGTWPIRASDWLKVRGIGK